MLDELASISYSMKRWCNSIMRDELAKAGVPKSVVEEKLLHQFDETELPAANRPRTVEQGVSTEQKTPIVPPEIAKGTIVKDPTPVVEKPKAKAKSGGSGRG